MQDTWDEGYGAGLSGITHWPDVVLGRFLKDWERKGLAAGWRAGLRDAAAYQADMAGAVASGVDMFAAVGGDEGPIPY